MKRTNLLFSIFLSLVVLFMIFATITLCFSVGKVRYILLSSEVILFATTFFVIQFEMLKLDRDKEKEQIALSSETFFHQFVNCIENVKKSLEKGKLTYQMYDELERDTANFLHLLHILQPTLQIYHLDQAYVHYVKNVEELYQYLFEIKKSLQVLKEMDAEKKPLYDHIKREDSIYTIVENSIVFLEDYLDILLIEIYPFLAKNKKKNFVAYCKNIQENG